ncbi:MAG: DegT/DnrJ/EryC1/StrS family aminotransferase, partial [Desulfobulbaceae bacterium]|nr:DegT/DnrJ/EryC1/StrS family aminotransferase [Desulfobulbaceae bacterium]
MNAIPRIPLVDLARIHRALDQEILNTITRVIEKGDFIQGSEVTRFEDAFAAFCKADFAIGVASGTDALHLALKAAGVGPGDTVITAANTFIATALAIHFTGANLLLI